MLNQDNTFDNQIGMISNANTQNPGPATLASLYSSGIGYKSLNGNLYQYHGGYYKELNDEQEISRIARFLHEYVTRVDSQTGMKFYEWSKTHHIRESLDYVKKITGLNSDEQVNPPGINLANGYLKLEYDEMGLPKFVLYPHSPDHIFTYKSKVIYNPDADPTLFEECFNKIIQDEEQQEIFLRVLSSCFDLDMVRKRHARATRALILIGEGANGKDTLRIWTELLLGSFGLTSVNMRSFKDADDKNNLFGLPPLATSLVNWPSENSNVLLDKCDKLKEVITGDTITASFKGKDHFTFKPKTVCLFNVNQLPRMRTDQEAITSRFAIIEFKSKFKSNPDPSKPYEVKADPRYKEDPEFIVSYILPAFLNRLIVAFTDLLKDGVDYSINEPLLKEIREENNHLAIFVRELELEECDPNDGMLTSELYNKHYIPWCIKESRMEPSSNMGVNPKIINSNEYDKTVPNVRQFTPMLKRSVFPNLQTKQTSQGTLLGLKLKNPPQQDFSNIWNTK